MYNEYFAKNSFIISKIPFDEEVDDTFLYSFDGKVLDSFEKSEENYLGGILSNDGTYYSASNEHNKTIIHNRKIENGKFSERKVFNELKVGK